MDTISIPTTYEGPPPPKGWRIRCVRAPKKDDVYLDLYGGGTTTAGCDWNRDGIVPILERIEPVKLTRWVNVYNEGICDCYMHSTEDAARRNSSSRTAIATAVPVEIVYTPDK